MKFLKFARRREEMNQILEKMKEMELNAPCNIEKLNTIEQKLNVVLPRQYMDFMQLHDGGEGPIGEYAYLAIWDLNEMLSFNQSSDINKYIFGLIYFASDRGGTLFAFDTNRDMKIVELQADSIDYSEEVELIADSFEEFVEYIYCIDDSEFDDSEFDDSEFD